MDLPNGATPKGKVACLALAGASAGLSVYAFREACKSYREIHTRSIGAGLISGAFAGLSTFLALSAFSGDGLERVTDSKGRLWAIIPPGKSYSDAEGVVFQNRTKGALPTESKAGRYDEIFLLLESSKGVPAWVWSEQSVIGRHSRKPFFVRLRSLLAATLENEAYVLDMKKVDLDRVKQLLAVASPANWDKELEPSAQLLKPGTEAPEKYDEQQFFYREYDTVS